MTDEIRRIINQIRGIQEEYDTDWSDSLADLAIQLADAVER